MNAHSDQYHGNVAKAVDDRVTPWIEIDPAALRHNVNALSALAERPVLAVLKCHAYGLDESVVALCLDPLPTLWGFAVATAEEAFAIRSSGARKPILLLGDFADSDGAELVQAGVALCTYSRESGPRFLELARRLGHPIKIHAKIDVGVNRLGIPHDSAERWVAELIDSRAVEVAGTFCNLAETKVAAEQLKRFRAIVDGLRSNGYDIGLAHAAASYALTHMPDCALDMIRPGLMIYGGFPDDTPPDFIGLRCAHRLRGRVIRVSDLRCGEGVGYSQAFVAERATRIATVMCGWSDGYSFKANSGCPILINGQLYPLIARMANFSIVDLGPAGVVREGDIATLVGPEPGIRPNELAAMSDGAGTGAYNQIRYSACLPKYLEGPSC
jgi:alanine racemase